MANDFGVLIADIENHHFFNELQQMFVDTNEDYSATLLQGAIDNRAEYVKAYLSPLYGDPLPSFALSSQILKDIIIKLTICQGMQKGGTAFMEMPDICKMQHKLLSDINSGKLKLEPEPGATIGLQPAYIKSDVEALTL